MLCAVVQLLEIKLFHLFFPQLAFDCKGSKISENCNRQYNIALFQTLDKVNKPSTIEVINLGLILNKVKLKTAYFAVSWSRQLYK